MKGALACPYCGSHVSADAHYCEQCGTPLDQATNSRRRRHRSNLWPWIGGFSLLALVVVAAGWWFGGTYVSGWFQPESRVSIPVIPPSEIAAEPDVGKEPSEVVPRPMGGDYRAIIQAMRASVLSVNAYGSRGTNSGSGFLYNDEGRVVTNYHVVEASDRFEVVDSQGQRHRAYKMEHDTNLDLAMLYVPSLSGRQPVPLGADLQPEPGDKVLAFGSPHGLPVAPAEGLLSGSGLQIRCGDRPFYDLLQLTAPVVRGYSGGPVVHAASGKVVGIIVCAVDPSQAFNISYALPMKLVSSRLQQWAGMATPQVPLGETVVTRTVPVRIGLMADLSGARAPHGAAMAEGAALALREMEATLRTLGYDVSLTRYDTKGRVDWAMDMASRARYDQDVFAVIGADDAVATATVVPILGIESLALVTPANTDLTLPAQGWANFTRLLAPDSAQGAYAAKFAAEKGARTVYVLDDGTEYSRAMAAGFTRAARLTGISVIGADSVTDATSAQVAERAAKSNPDALYVAGGWQVMATAVKGARAAGHRGIIITPDSLGDARFIAQAGTGEGLYFTTARAPLPEPFRALFQKEYNKPAHDAAVLGYDAARLVLEALERYGKEHPGKVPTRDELARRIRQTKGFKGWAVSATFDHRGENVDARLCIYDWQGTEPRTVKCGQ